MKRGYIRFVSQIPGYVGSGKTPATFYNEQWGSRSSEASGLCSYAVLSMQLSYLGFDCLPGEMFTIMNGNTFNRMTIVNSLIADGANLSSELRSLHNNDLKLSDFQDMLRNYENDTNYSPVFMFMEYGKEWKNTHAVLVIGYNEGKYYLANPETMTGMGRFEIEEKDGIMYIKNATTKKYNGRRISTISQLRLDN